jgi:hypothetical protein
LITPGERSVTQGQYRLRGLAWSGEAPVTHVDVSVGGDTWEPAALASPTERYA